MKFYIDLEDTRFAYLKEWLEKKYEYVDDMNDAEIIILGIHNMDIPKNTNYNKVISFNPLNIERNIALNNCERFLNKNAYLTALGLLKQIDLSNKKVVIFGNGRIATYLAQEIKEPVTIICRHPKDNQEPMSSKAYLNADVIINTIPHQLELDFNALPKTTKIIDLASKPYGFNHDDLKRKGFDVCLMSGIPGKVFPKEAAQLIYEEVMECLED